MRFDELRDCDLEALIEELDRTTHPGLKQRVWEIGEKMRAQRENPDSHIKHYQHCNCLADSWVCCRQECSVCKGEEEE